jgi:hypothetical protein
MGPAGWLGGAVGNNRFVGSELVFEKHKKKEGGMRR